MGGGEVVEGADRQGGGILERIRGDEGMDEDGGEKEGLEVGDDDEGEEEGG